MKKTIIAVSLLAALALTSCGSNSSSSEQTASKASTAVTEDTTAADTADAENSSAETSEQSSAEDTTEQVTAPQQEVGYEGMKEVAASSLNDGDYTIKVDSSSSMFKIADCILHVKDGSMNADIIIDSKSYDALFMGTKEEAGNASESGRITYTENEKGQSVFTVPVEALDKEIQCASLSAKKQEWYARTLVFRADSLPAEALKEGGYATVQSLGLEDGEYTVEAKLDGGSGRASIESPAKVAVKDGKAQLTVTWSSDKYDKMVVEDVTYLPQIVDGHSVFSIDIKGFDNRMPVGAETTAMSEPHMIDYYITLDSSTIKKCE